MISNIRLNIKIGYGTDTFEIPLDVNPEPLYFDPEFLLLKFFNQDSSDYYKFFESALSTILMGSLSFDNLLAMNRIEVLKDGVDSYVDGIISALGYKYVECYATYWFGIKNYAEVMKSISKSKTLGDFEVSYRGESALDRNKILGDAKDCMDAIIQKINAIGAAGLTAAQVSSFRDKYSSVKDRSRLWDYRQIEYGIPNASMKVKMIDGKVYKTGSFYQYWMSAQNYQAWSYDGWYNKNYL